jgi:hypothetical protein
VLGMTGLCCPSAEGSMLACCNTVDGAMADEWRSLIYADHAGESERPIPSLFLCALLLCYVS